MLWDGCSRHVGAPRPSCTGVQCARRGLCPGRASGYEGCLDAAFTRPNTRRLSHHALIGHTPRTKRWSSWTRATAVDSPVCLVRALHAPWSEAAIDIRCYHGLATLLAPSIPNRRFILKATWRRRSAHGPTSTKVGSDCRLGGIWLICRSRKPTRSSAMQIIRSTTTQQSPGDRR